MCTHNTFLTTELFLSYFFLITFEKHGHTYINEQCKDRRQSATLKSPVCYVKSVVIKLTIVTVLTKVVSKVASLAKITVNNFLSIIV